MFDAFYLSFYSKKFYCAVAASWRGIAFSLLFAVVLLHAVVFVVFLNRGYNDFLKNEAPAIVSQIPNIYVKSGELRIDKSWPYEIKSKSGATLARFDTTFDEAKFPAGQIWVTADKVYLRRSTYDEMRVYSLKNVDDFTFNADIAEGMIAFTKKWFLAAMFPIVLIIFFIARAIQVGIYSLIGLGLNKVMGVYLSYQQIVRLCVAALVPVLVIDCVLLMLYPLDWPWTGFFLAMGYLIFGLRANRELIR